MATATPPALVGAALRVANPSLYWFVATAWYALAARCPDPGAALAAAVDHPWALRSDSPAFDHVVRAVAAAGITAVQTGPKGRVDLLIDNLGQLTLARRDKALLTLLLWFMPSTRWSRTLPPGAPPALRLTSTP